MLEKSWESWGSLRRTVRVPIPYQCGIRLTIKGRPRRDGSEADIIERLAAPAHDLPCGRRVWIRFPVIMVVVEWVEDRRLNTRWPFFKRAGRGRWRNGRVGGYLWFTTVKRHRKVIYGKAIGCRARRYGRFHTDRNLWRRIWGEYTAFQAENSNNYIPTSHSGQKSRPGWPEMGQWRSRISSIGSISDRWTSWRSESPRTKRVERDTCLADVRSDDERSCGSHEHLRGLHMCLEMRKNGTWTV